MYAEVNLTLDRRNRVLAIPVAAVDLGRDASSAQVDGDYPGQPRRDAKGPARP